MDVRILVVGDDGITALDIEETLAANGYEVATAVPATSGAVRRALKTSPDVVVLDISGHSSSTTAAARQMVERLQIPVVLLTGLCTEGGESAELAGRMSYLDKPFREQDLIHLIRNSLGGLWHDLRNCEGFVEKEVESCPP